MHSRSRVRAWQVYPYGVKRRLAVACVCGIGGAPLIGRLSSGVGLGCSMTHAISRVGLSLDNSFSCTLEASSGHFNSATVCMKAPRKVSSCGKRVDRKWRCVAAGARTLPSASNRHMRGPITHAPANAERPPVRCTTPHPAKSTTPVPNSFPSDLKAQAHPVPLHTPASPLHTLIPCSTPLTLRLAAVPHASLKR
jgi:hypothetical protein